MPTVRIFVEGRVQGVGYRAFLAREAVRLALSGWVRNRLDGRVEALASGPPEALEALISAAGRGPAHGRVDAVHAEPTEADGGDGFRVAATL